ncbi:MAG: hypothetical protein M0007_14510 [Actinomycetota bacterium]|nr:hypothetical protein [Actinomycetota bacterium]
MDAPSADPSPRAPGTAAPDGAEADVLDLLAAEDELVANAMADLDGFHDPGPGRPGDPASQRRGIDAARDRGNIEKFLVEHFAVRLAARECLAREVAGHEWAGPLAAALGRHDREWREVLDRLDAMSKGVAADELNLGQDFDAVLDGACAMAAEEIAEELDTVVPGLVEALGPDERRRILSPAEKVRRHAPLHPNPSGPHFYERIGPIERVHAGWDRLRSMPTSVDRYLPDDLRVGPDAAGSDPARGDDPPAPSGD